MQEPNLRIIVIDDNPAIHHDFIKILTRAQDSDIDNLSKLDQAIFGDKSQEESFLPKFQIDVASQGQEGVHRIEQALKEGNPYALAFVDIRMPPGWDGIETIKHIFALDENIQVVICTAYSDYTWEKTIEELGQRDNLLILKKPFDNIAVRQLACALTKKWQLMQQIITKRIFLEEKLQYQVLHDELTGLPNRLSIMENIHKAISNCPKNEILALFFMDLDRFKLINDSLGHAAGDELIKSFSHRLEKLTDDEHIPARLGGDEFIVLFKQAKDEKNVTDFAQKLLCLMQEPFQISNRSIFITNSVGISLFPKDGTTADELLRHADTAMYHAKDLGSNQIQFYKEELNTQALKHLEQKSDMHMAIEKEQFFLCYQPEYNIVSKKLITVEALVRWQHPTKGIILPMDFIPLAEKTGLIIPLGKWILKTACQQNKQWQDAGLPPIKIAVNVTASQFKYGNFVDTVLEVLKETQLKPEYLELEITENTIVSDPLITSVIKDLKKLGLFIVLDDFGTGYSSLGYLKNLPLDGLKIDRSFIQNVALDRGDEVIISSIIAMATSLNLEVIAEGVELPNQLNFLKSYNCADVQGFYFSEPLLPEQLANILGKVKETVE